MLSKILTGRKLYDSTRGHMAFWLSNIGMLGMTVAFGVAGVAQVYMERKMKWIFYGCSNEISIHFVVLLLLCQHYLQPELPYTF